VSELTSWIPLVRNEVLKIWKKKRFFVILLILAVLIPIFTYAQLKVSMNIQEQIGTDWRINLQQQINDYNNRISSPRIPEEWRSSLRVQVQILEYHLEHDINPSTPNAVTFTKEFLENSIGLFLPLMILVIASDLVSSEHSSGTIKLLLTRPVRRWKVLMSKFIAMMMYVSLSVFSLALFSYLISGVVFGYGGWNQPILTGFQIAGLEVDTTYVHALEQWRYLIMALGLAWFSCMVVACLALMVSVLVRSTAAGMGIMLATLIAGLILSSMVSSWESAKYFFMVNLSTIHYLSGEIPPIEGMTLSFSLAVLSVWALISVIISFSVFTKQDILN
jgi:ABC-2 type transport system permease protein